MTKRLLHCYPHKCSQQHFLSSWLAAMSRLARCVAKRKVSVDTIDATCKLASGLTCTYHLVHSTGGGHPSRDTALGFKRPLPTTWSPSTSSCRASCLAVRFLGKYFLLWCFAFSCDGIMRLSSYYNQLWDLGVSNFYMIVIFIYFWFGYDRPLSSTY